DYLVPATLDEAAVPGCRVRIRFAGRLTGGYLLERAEASDHQGTLAFLERVVSPEPVLGAEAAGLARAVADRYGGTLAGVLPPASGARAAPPPPRPRREGRPRGGRGHGHGHGRGRGGDPAGCARAGAVGAVSGRAVVPGRAGRRAVAAGGVERAAGPGLAHGDRPGRGRHRRVRAGDPDRGP